MNDFQRPDRIEKALAQNGLYVSKTQGASMEPMLKQGRDTVVIKKPEFPLKKYDIPVYHRDSRYLMHRIVRVTKTGYIICGDNMTELERDIKDSDIVGVLAGTYQGNKYIEYGDDQYMRYAKRAVRTYPVRVLKHFVFRVKRKLKKVLKIK